MKVRYVGTNDPTDAVETQVFGQTYRIGEWVTLPDTVTAAQREKLKGNHTFEVDKGSDGDLKTELRGKLDALGVPYDARAGVSKLAELLEAATADPEDLPQSQTELAAETAENLSNVQADKAKK